MKSKKKVRKAPKSVVRTLTLSKYNWGMHHFDDKGLGEPSFRESLSPFHFMARELFDNGVELGTKVKITMKPLKKKKVS